MTDTYGVGMNGPLADLLVDTGRFFTRGKVSRDGHTVHKKGDHSSSSYRDHRTYDKMVRSIRGANCTGPCSWKAHAKDGIIAWEAQQTDCPSVDPNRPECEPRSCPHGALLSWYTYPPTRMRYPYIRGVLLEVCRQAKA